MLGKKTKLVRIELYITKAQRKSLARVSKHTHLSNSAIVRELLDKDLK